MKDARLMKGAYKYQVVKHCGITSSYAIDLPLTPATLHECGCETIGAFNKLRHLATCYGRNVPRTLVRDGWLKKGQRLSKL